jgi:hypothetical protein
MNEWFAHHLLRLTSRERDGAKGRFLSHHARMIEEVLAYNHIYTPSLAQVVVVSGNLWRPRWLAENEPR